MTYTNVDLQIENKYKTNKINNLISYDKQYQFNYTNKVNIKKMKITYIKKYPNSTLSHVLKNEPDEMPVIEFLAKVSTWLKI